MYNAYMMYGRVHMCKLVEIYEYVLRSTKVVQLHKDAILLDKFKNLDKCWAFKVYNICLVTPDMRQ